MKSLVASKWKLAVRVIPFVIVILAVKFVLHRFNLEFLGLSPLFTAIISANIFLIGFLISGVLADYKEAEKIPGELACCLETMSDEGLIIHQTKKDPAAQAFLKHLEHLTRSLDDWFHKKLKTNGMMGQIRELNAYFPALEPLTQANFIARLKQEQNNLRKLVTRIHTIRETDFNEAGYAIAEIITLLLIAGMIFIKIDPFYQSMFFVGFVSFILIYMVILIKDLDNPFGYYDNSLSQDISLKPLSDFRRRIKELNREPKEEINN